MQDELSWSQLHDATLVGLEFRWEDGDMIVRLRTGLAACPQAQIHGLRGKRIDCPRLHPWGPSVSVNELRGPSPLPDGPGQRLEIEMQSGDVLVLDAEAFVLEAV